MDREQLRAMVWAAAFAQEAVSSQTKTLPVGGSPYEDRAFNAANYAASLFDYKAKDVRFINHPAPDALADGRGK